MILPFNVIEDKNAPKDALFLIGLRFKTIPVGNGEPPRFKEVVDWEATAKASGIITGIRHA